MSTLIPGQRKWSMQRSREGERVYKITYRVEADDTPGFAEGPATVLQTPGLPLPGTEWLVDGDVDLWAFCTPEASVTQVMENERCSQYDVELTFSTRPNLRCHDNQIEDPLLELQRVSGGYIKDKTEGSRDRFGQPIISSSWEEIRGPQNEWDQGRDSIKVEQNVPDLQLALLASLKDHVNDLPLWGMPARCIKFSSYSWEELYYGQCYKYYKRTLEFEVNDRTFDRDMLDEGTKVLHGHWDGDVYTADNFFDEDSGNDLGPPNPDDPRHFDRAKDKNGENIRMLLDGRGLPAARVQESYVSLLNTNVGEPLSNGVWWLRVEGSTTPSVWASGTYYVRGNLVTNGGDTWACLSPNSGKTPSETSRYWKLMENGLSDQGTYDEGTSYDMGDIVTGVLEHNAGRRHVEYYLPGNLLLLSIPAVIG